MNTFKTVLAAMMATIALSSCGMSGKASVDDEKEYPEALFTLGKRATPKIQESFDNF